jgi:hypothetical protein
MGRGSTSERGYGTNHMRERATWKPLVERGEVACARCGRFIAPGSKWHLGHDHLSGGYVGPEHARCNIAERNRRHNRKRRLTSRNW